MREMLKIGVMTWFRYENYGTALQAVALQEVLRSMGCRPFLIDYRPRSKKDRFEPLTLAALIDKAAGKVKRMFQGQARPYSSDQRSALFSSFITKHCEITAPANSYPELKLLASELDGCVCGSDQVWSPNCFDENYYLPFVEGAKRISYAPSFGASSIADPEIARRVKLLVANFKALSVRETTGADIIEQLTGMRSQVVVDPTLLLDKAKWNQLASEGGESKRKYILCYFLGDPDRYEHSALECSKALGLPLVSIPTVFGQNHSAKYEVGPEEFLRLFMDASYVLTDSFHGTVFSVNFGIPFSVYKRFSDSDPRSQNSRITSFLKLTSLEERLVPADCLEFSSACDFTEANERLEKMRTSSILYLRDALEGLASRDEASSMVGPVQICEQCCGCGACAAVCPRDAISIITDDKGFQAYTIDSSLCIGCGICQSVCPMSRVTARRVHDAKELRAYQSSDADGLRKSSSGALGADLASLLSESGYRVFGCVYERELDEAAIIEVASGSLDRIRGSKYLQARSAEAIAEASEPGAGKAVFFGTPCQVAGLDAVLRRRGAREGAVLVDLICHGVPTRLLWQRYLEERRRDGMDEHPDVYFRWKANGWSPIKMMMMRDSKMEYFAVEPKDNFYALFSQGHCFAKSCYECPYRERSAADIRMGDYWGGRFAGDSNGVSMAIVMTDVGAALMERLAELGAWTESYDLQEYWDSQFPYNQGLPLVWNELIADLRSGAFDLSSIRKKYCAGLDQKKKIEGMKSTAKKMLGRVKHAGEA